MKKLLAVLLSLFAFHNAKAQLNIELLHQLVAHSKDEYDHQITARDKQAITTANQQVNTQLTSVFKKRYNEISQRFIVISYALQTINSSIESALLVQQIIDEHHKIMELLWADPQYIALVIPAEKEILHKAKLLARYILGLMLSAGELNYMKQSDRRVLYDHLTLELRGILSTTRGLTKSLYYSAMLQKIKGKPMDFIKKDKQIAERILNEVKGVIK